MTRPDLDRLAQLPLVDYPCFLLWGCIARGGRLVKIPKDPARPANNLLAWPRHGFTFERITDVLRAIWAKDPGTHAEGIGFNFNLTHPFVGLDFDHPVSPEWLVILGLDGHY